MPHLHHAALGSSRTVFITLILIFTGLAYLRGWLSLRSNFLKVSSVWRPVSFLLGLFLVWVAMASPMAALDHELLIVHMLQHLLLMTLAPPLIWLGAPERSLLHSLPQRFLESLIVPLRQARGGRTFGKFLVRPRFAWLAACATLIGWHIPTLFELGMSSPAWHLVEHTSFLVTGLLFWWPVVQPPNSGFRQDLSII